MMLSQPDTCQAFPGFGLTETPTVPDVARPRKPEGALVLVGGKVPEPVRDQLDRIAASEGISRSALLARIIARYVEEYPTDES